MQPLENVKIVDLTQMLSGPLASMYFGDLGAEVVKVERPNGGDFTRQFPPFVDGQSGYFGSLNRNKHSVTLDLGSDDGRELLLDLVEDADVFLENYKFTTIEKLGLEYEIVRERNPDIVYCSIKAFGKDSPYRGLPAFDIIMQAMGGAMAMTGEPEGPPLRTNVPIGDIAASMFATQGILAALFSRASTDTGGEFIEVSMLNSLLSWLGPRGTNSLIREKPYPRHGNDHQLFVPYGVFDTADSYICIALASENFWEAFCEAIDRPDLTAESRFDTMADRRQNRAELEAILADVLAGRTTEEWFEVFQEYGIPAGPVYDTIELWEDPHVQQQAMLEHLAVETSDESLPVVRYPLNFSTYERQSRSPPGLGEDTRAYLRSLGVDESTIDEYEQRDVI